MRLNPPVTLKFGTYSPDLPDLNNPGSSYVRNCIPASDSYEPFNDLVVYSDALEGPCLGAYSSKQDDGSTFTFSGTSSKLYKITNSSWSDISVGGGYSTSDNVWNFTTFGNNILATNYNDVIQSYVMGTSSAFANLGGTPPQARYITTAKNFVFVGNTFDGTDGEVRYRVRWSALGDETSWAISSTTQADQQDLDNAFGAVQGVFGGEYVTIFQEKSITRATYIGSPIIWAFDEVERDRGLLVPRSAVKVGARIFYLSDNGFYSFNGQSSEPIGENQIDDFFFSDFDLDNQLRMSVVADTRRKLILWSYPSNDANQGTPDRILVFNYARNANKRWSIVELEQEVLFKSLSEGYTLEQLDNINSSLDDLPYSLDSDKYKGGVESISCFNSDFKQCSFDGSALTATIDTTEGEIFPGNTSDIYLLRPLIQGDSNTTITTKLGIRSNITEAVTFGNALNTNSIGEIVARSNGRYHKARVIIAGGFNKAQGIQVLEAGKCGVR